MKKIRILHVQTVVKIWLARVLVLLGSWTVALGQSSSYSTAKSDLETIRKSPDTTKAKLLLNFAKDHYSSDDSIILGLKYLLESYQISQKNNYTIGIIKSAYELGSLYAYSKNILQSNDYYLISLKYAEANNLIQFKASALMGLGLNYYTQSKWTEALQKFKESIAQYKLAGLQTKIETPNYLMAMVDLELGNYSQAENIFRETKQRALARKDSLRASECELGLARADLGNKHYEEALNKLESILPFNERKNEKVVLAIINYYKGLIYFEQNNLNNALKFTNIAYDYSSKIGLQSNVLEITLLLSKIYKKMGRADLAYQYLLENKNYQDSLNSRDVAAQLALSNAGYEFGKKENYLKTEIEAHEQKSSVFLFFMIFFCAAALASIIAFYYIKQERKKSEKLLLNILPKETAAELKLYGKVEPKQHASVSILFCDI